MKRVDFKKYFLIGFLIIIAYVGYLIIKPFVAALLSSFILAYIFYPIYRKLKNSTKNEILSATLTTIIILLIIIIPTVYISNSLLKESINIYQEGTIHQIVAQITSYLSEDKTIPNVINSLLKGFGNYAKTIGTDFISKIPTKIIELLIIVYTTFGLFIIGENLIQKTKNLLPVKNKDHLIKNLGTTIHGIVYGLFVIAVIEFVIALISFKLIGSSVALILAIIVGILAFIPILGPALIWVPYILIELLNKNYQASIILLIMGIVLLVVENIVRPKIIGNKANLHSIIILIGTLGGVQLMGFIGIVVGPLILSSLIIIISEYYPETL